MPLELRRAPDRTGQAFDLDRFDAGHGTLVVNERVRQMEVLLRFAARHVPGGGEPEA